MEELIRHLYNIKTHNSVVVTPNKTSNSVIIRILSNRRYNCLDDYYNYTNQKFDSIKIELLTCKNSENYVFNVSLILKDEVINDMSIGYEYSCGFEDIKSVVREIERLYSIYVD
jgi:hypothetical protein